MSAHFHSLSLKLIFFSLLIWPASLWAETPDEEAVPSAYSGDVPYVPTPQTVVDKMLEMAQIKSTDYIIDLGSGDGRIVLTAAKKYGARGHGVELNEERVKYSRKAAKKMGLSGKAQFKNEDIFETDLSKASVLTMYLLSEVNLKLRPRLLKELKPGTRIVSHAFDMDEWSPDKKVVMPAGQNLYLWIVPAKVAGSWPVKIQQGKQNLQLDLHQDFQNVRGTAKINGETFSIKKGRVIGNQVRLDFDTEDGPRQFRGSLRNGNLVGVLSRQTVSRLPASVTE